jgi:hypothetical protein
MKYKDLPSLDYNLPNRVLSASSGIPTYAISAYRNRKSKGKATVKAPHTRQSPRRKMLIAPEDIDWSMSVNEIARLAGVSAQWVRVLKKNASDYLSCPR